MPLRLFGVMGDIDVGDDDVVDVVDVVMLLMV